MADVVIGKPDGSEFEASPEVSDQVDLLDLIGVNDIDPDTVSDTWSVTPDGKLFVAKATQDMARYYDQSNLLYGKLPASESVVIWLTTGQAANDIKQSLGLAGGFTFLDHHVASDTVYPKTSYDDFLEYRQQGLWSLQAPVLGEQFLRYMVADLPIHDRILTDHFTAALVATDNQVQFLSRLCDVSTSGVENPIELSVRRVMLAALYDYVFSRGDHAYGGYDLLASVDGRVERKLISAAMSRVPELDVDYDYFQIRYDSLKSLSSALAKDMGFDSEKEQAEARARAKRVIKIFGL